MQIEVNSHNKKFVESARKAGFTDDQITFLSEWFMFASDADNFLQY